MKNLFLYPLCLVIVALMGNTAVAQNNEPPSIVNKTLTRHFSPISDIKWTNCGTTINEKIRSTVFMSTFSSNLESSIVFIDDKGNLLAKGRKINKNQFPMVVRENLKNIQSNIERKYGSLTFGCIYEVLNSDGITKYYIPMENTNRYVMVVIDSWGNTSIAKEKMQNKGSDIKLITMR